ncbi:Nif3-like dinuclear metal center hexameric protein [Deinococcus misasensis]|uniref:Nif3-like dinuclear metal center hexameric protein n=1 Tax=Deinococcus misasensis TaxID=392413 RepID=UPI00068E2BD2|nr:Nif3-like dinuclear metal center hexameric protein [Deinococcus misasensis]
MHRDELVQWLNTYLRISDYKDVSNNGLQIEGKDEVTRVAVAVDASLRTIEEAVDSGADILITHHGLFWGKPQMVTGPMKKRIQKALEGDLSIYAMHIPLDAHPEVGNNVMLARALNLRELQPFGDWAGKSIGFWGELPFELELQDFSDRIQKTTGEICLVHGGGAGIVKKVGVISGAASDSIPLAAAMGLDTFVTGEPKHQHFHDAFEYGVNVIYAGHYETETFGVRALAAKLEDTFNLPWQFIHLPTGL